MTFGSGSLLDDPARGTAWGIESLGSERSSESRPAPFLVQAAENIVARAVYRCSQNEEIRSTVFLFDGRPSLVEAISYDTPVGPAAQRRLSLLIDERYRERHAVAFLYLTPSPAFITRASSLQPTSGSNALLIASRSPDSRVHRAIAVLDEEPCELQFLPWHVIETREPRAALVRLISMEARRHRAKCGSDASPNGLSGTSLRASALEVEP